MDLQEWVKKGNVWKLESEAFKKPIEIKICYDDNDKKLIDDSIEKVKNLIASHEKYIESLKSQIAEQDKYLKAYDDMLIRYENVIWEYEKDIEKKDEALKSLYKVVADIKTREETQQWAILHLQEKTGQILKNLTKQPIVIHDKWFISWHESVALWTINIPDWDYLLVAKYVIWEHNEYVENENEIIFDKVHVEGQCYFPFYKLEWWTPLDVPTATVYYDLIFMPI